MKTRNSLLASFAAIASLAVCGVAHASISFTISSPVISGSGPYTWTYTPTLNTGESLTATVPGASCDASTSTATCGSFFTLYDIGGYVAGSAFAPTGWGISVSLTGQTPSTQIVSDNGAVENITFYYTGGTTIDGTGQTLGSFGFNSGINSEVNGMYSYETNSGNPPDQGDGHIPTPSPTPEPSSLALLGTGLLGAAGVARRRFLKR